MTTEAFAPHGSYVRLRGEFDLASTGDLEHAINGEITRGHRHLVIDLSAATFLDCATVGTLLRAVAALRREPDAAIVLSGATGIVKRLLDLVEIDRVFDVVPDLEDATQRATDGNHADGWRRSPVRRGW